MKYERLDERPIHPVTGLPADGFSLERDAEGKNVRRPYWRSIKRATLLGGELKVEDTFFSTGEAARLVGKTRQCIAKWIETRGLKATRGPAPWNGGRQTVWYIRGSDLYEFLALHGLKLGVVGRTQPFTAEELKVG